MIGTQDVYAPPTNQGMPSQSEMFWMSEQSTGCDNQPMAGGRTTFPMYMPLGTQMGRQLVQQSPHLQMSSHTQFSRQMISDPNMSAQMRALPESMSQQAFSYPRVNLQMQALPQTIQPRSQPTDTSLLSTQVITSAQQNPMPLSNAHFQMNQERNLDMQLLPSQLNTTGQQNLMPLSNYDYQMNQRNQPTQTGLLTSQPNTTTQMTNFHYQMNQQSQQVEMKSLTPQLNTVAHRNLAHLSNSNFQVNQQHQRQTQTELLSSQLSAPMERNQVPWSNFPNHNQQRSQPTPAKLLTPQLNTISQMNQAHLSDPHLQVNPQHISQLLSQQIQQQPQMVQGLTYGCGDPNAQNSLLCRPPETKKRLRNEDSYKYMKSRAHKAHGIEHNYVCGYCGTERKSASACSDGRVRIRCSCGGQHEDGKVRMHAYWIMLTKDHKKPGEKDQEGKLEDTKDELSVAKECQQKESGSEEHNEPQSKGLKVLIGALMDEEDNSGNRKRAKATIPETKTK